MNQEKYALGVDFGGTSVKLARVSSHGRILARHAFPTQSLTSVQHWIDTLANCLPSLQTCPLTPFEGIGVGLPGFVDFHAGLVHSLTNVPGWSAVPLARLLQQRFHLPTFIDNDVNAMAIGECTFGAGRGLQHAVFITLGTGVGGAILINGSLYRGANSCAGELGHVSINMNGPHSPMGQGGLEQYVGNRQIVDYTLSRIQHGANPAPILQFAGQLNRITPKIIATAAQHGDPLSLHVFDYVADCLSTMIASVAYVLQPEAFIIGGGVSAAGPILFEPLRRHLAHRLSPHFFQHLRLLPAALGNDAGVIGCASLALASHAP